MTRGQLAKAAGVHTETIRFYEQKGLIPEPSRSPASLLPRPDASTD
ncbi:MAG: MerR family DNA-binding transcriptional regulator [Bacteroidetes bacterium]|nr:MerR family DNA-binding transcriptional regulator [Bacteroidota bacterium]